MDVLLDCNVCRANVSDEKIENRLYYTGRNVVVCESQVMHAFGLICI